MRFLAGFWGKPQEPGEGSAPLSDREARHGDCILHLSSVPETALTVLDPSLAPVCSTVLPEVTDPHSLCVHGGRLAVVSTGTDEVIGYRLDGPRAHSPEILWSPTRRAGRVPHQERRVH